MRVWCSGWTAAMLCVLAIIACGAGQIKIDEMKPPLTIEVIAPAEQTISAAEPVEQTLARVLIYHTHTWEAYEMTEDARYTPTETWRTKSEAHNMVRIGEELAAELGSRGFFVVHDRTAFEPPTLSSAYTRSLDMLKTRIEQGETYDYILDVHRDAYSGDWKGANAVLGEDGVSRAYVMLLIGKGTGTTGAGFDERPDWPRNLALAQEMTTAMNDTLPGIGREVKIKTGRFNQHISPGAVLVEVGNNKNTLSEALASCPVIAEALLRVHMARKEAQ